MENVARFESAHLFLMLGNCPEFDTHLEMVFLFNFGEASFVSS
jgi:hypothetical protein